MNESLLLRFESGGRLLGIRSFSVAQGVEFEGHRDASPLVIAVGILPVFPKLLDAVRQRHDWRETEFMLDGVLDAGGIRLSGFEGDRFGLPSGVYDITVEVEAYRFKNPGQRITINKGQQAVMTLVEQPDLRRIRLRAGIDAMTEKVISDPRSKVDDLPLLEWLSNPQPRASRQACLLNVMAKLRVPPAPDLGVRDPLTKALDYLFFADVDRVYAAVKPGLDATLADLVSKKLWVKEGRPNASIHERLLDRIPAEDRDNFTKSGLVSYRQGGRNGIQVVLAKPRPSADPASHYADIDIDLGNPLWDLEGLVVHLGEVLDSGRTDHLKLHGALDSGVTKDFLYYDLGMAAAAGG